MPEIDLYSLAAFPIVMTFGDTELSNGTAFVWKKDATYFIVTNWHNLTGINPITGKHLSKMAAEPDGLVLYLNQKGAMGTKLKATLPLRENGIPKWWVHPKFGKDVDIAMLPVVPPPEAEMYPVNEMPDVPMTIGIGVDVYVLGFPFGPAPPGLPIWKRGSIASEPEIIGPFQPYILVDTASRPGMSGSPVILRSWGSYLNDKNELTMVNKASRFIGIYSGRLVPVDAIDAQLGRVWPTHLIEEIANGQIKDT